MFFTVLQCFEFVKKYFSTPFIFISLFVFLVQ